MIKLNNSFSEEQEKAVLDKVELSNKVGGRILLTSDEIEICEKHNIDPSKYSHIDKGLGGHRISNKVSIGRYVAGIGFYKIIDIKKNYQVHDGRVFDEMLITNYSKTLDLEFDNDEVLINARPFYNNASIGPKSQLKVGMILHIKEDTTVVNKTYRIVWEIL